LHVGSLSLEIIFLLAPQKLIFNFSFLLQNERGLLQSGFLFFNFAKRCGKTMHFLFFAKIRFFSCKSLFVKKDFEGKHLIGARSN